MLARLELGFRTVVFLAVFGFINFTPFYRQVLGGRAVWARDWSMFSAVGLDVCDVRYAQRLPDGTKVRIDRYDLLQYEDWLSAPKSVRKIKNEDGVASVGRKLCRALGPGADVRATARCASRKGWKRVARDDTNLCVR